MMNDRVDILVVDDLPEKLLVYETMLQGPGQNVVTARSGCEALRFVLDREFAVILLDVKMPELDGFETARLIRGRRQSAHTPIIFVTALADEMNTAQAYSLGAVDFILTPIVPEILRTKVGVFVELYKKTQQVKRQAEEHVALARAQAAHDAALEANRRLAFLSEATSILVSSLDYEAIPRDLASQAIPFLGDLCAVTLIGERDQREWRTEVAWIDPTSSSRTAASVKGDRELGPTSNLIRRVLDTGAGQLFCDVRPDAGPAPNAVRHFSDDAGPAAIALFEPHWAIVVPLRARGHTLGTLAVGLGKQERRFGPDDLALAADLAGRAAIAIDNARLYRDVQENDRRKNEFLAMLGHELRNPLAPMRNAIEIVKRLDLKDDNLHWASDVISRQLEHLVRLVDDLLDVSRIAGGKIQLRRQPVDIATVVARAVETSRPLIDARKHELCVDLPVEPIWLSADLVRLAQVLSNLLNNAAKYTEPGGKIALEVARSGDQAIFRVRDNGIGIPEESVSSIFDLFTQVDRSLHRAHGGLGVGLNLVRRLVEKHGGSVEVFSEGANRGSEFVIRLPTLPQGFGVDADCDAIVAAPRDPARRRILVVDDYPSSAESLMRMLQLGGHDVRIARDGPGAVEEVRFGRPEIVLLDIGLPGMDGYEVAQSIRALPDTEGLILIAMSGYGQEEDRRRSSEAGFNYHLTKPVDLAALFQLIAPSAATECQRSASPVAAHG
jgi:signal transduction histidine kinase/DNA-binding response OmpR family regulator